MLLLQYDPSEFFGIFQKLGGMTELDFPFFGGKRNQQ